MKEENVTNCNIGGQAVLEGVMMRGASSQAMAVWGNDGKLTLESNPLRTGKFMKFIQQFPFLRGSFILISTMADGIKIITKSAEMYGDESKSEDYKPSKFEQWLSKTLKIDIMTVAAFIGVVLGIGLSLLLFLVLPTFIAGLFGIESYVLRTLVEGVIKIGIFIGYLYLCTLIKDVRRTFEFHGAEHKTIACYEHGLELTPENAKKMTRLHPRCGTAFIFIVLIISILFGSIFPVDNTLLRMLVKLLMLIPVAGISYEALKWFARSKSGVARVLRYPGLQLQRLTTREPNEKQLEAAILAFKKVLFMENIISEDPEIALRAAQSEQAAEQTDETEPETIGEQTGNDD